MSGVSKYISVCFQLLLLVLKSLGTNHTVVKYKIKTSSVLTDTLIRDIDYQQKVTQMDCLLDLILMGESSARLLEEEPFEWKTLASFSNPFRISKQSYKSQRTKNKKFQLVDTSTLLGKFKSCCWTTVMYFFENFDKFRHTSSGLLHIPVKTSTLGFHSIDDQYIFVASDKKLLESFFSNSSPNILDNLARKYGMFVSTTVDRNPPQISYLVEPRSYTGSFTASSHLKISKNLLNLNGRTLTLGFRNWSPFIWRREKDRSLDGLQYLFLSEISKRENITFFYDNNIKYSGFGNLQPNGTWTGIIREMIEGSVDTVPTLAPTLQRFPVLTFTTPQFLISLVFCLQTPKEGRPWKALIYPLSPFVWILTLITFIVYLLAFVFKAKLEKNAALSSSLQILILQLFTILLDQPSQLPTSQLSRYMVFSWIFFCYMIGQAYKANLVGYLTFTEKQVFPTTFAELHESPQYSIMLQSVGGLEMEIFRTSRNPVIKGIAKRMTLETNLRKCIVKAASIPNTVCISWNSALADAVAKYSSDYPQLQNLYVARDDTGGSAHGTIALRKNSIYVQTFIRYVGWARATFLSDMWFQMMLNKIEIEAKIRAKLSQKTVELLPEENNEGHALSKGDLFIVLFMITLGLSLSVVTFLSEIFVSTTGTFSQKSHFAAKWIVQLSRMMRQKNNDKSSNKLVINSF